MTKRHLTPAEENAKIRLRSDRIARTLVSSVLTLENLYLVLGSFMQSAINELGWWAGQTWLKKDDVLTPTGWVFATSAPSSILGISRFHSTDISGIASALQGSDEYAVMPAMACEIAALTWHPQQEELQAVGVRHTVIVDVFTSEGLGLRILFILPNQNSLTNATRASLEAACALLPELYRRAISSQQLLFQSSHDSLTGLRNRRGLEDAFSDRNTWNRNGVDRTVFYLDLDRFKDINDTFGHNVGDEVLCELARRVVSASRPVDVQARLGGDEFLIIAESLDDSDSIERTADRYLDAIQKDFMTSDGSNHSLRISLGVARWQANSELSEAISRADAQMYRAKASGGHRAKIEELYLRGSEPTVALDPFQFNNSSLSIGRVCRNIDGGTAGYIATFPLPNSYSPEMMRDLAKKIRLTILDDSQSNKLGSSFEHDLLLHVERPRRSDKTNIELLLAALSETYQASNLHYLLDLEGITTDSANIARDLIGSSTVRIALANFGLGNAEIALTKEFSPSFFVLNADIIDKPSGANDVVLKAVGAISKSLKIPLLIPRGKSPQAIIDSALEEINLGESLYIEYLPSKAIVDENRTPAKGLS